MTNNIVSLPSLDNRFCFDYVFDDTINQSQVYARSVLNMVNSFLEGYNITVLAYGQTSSGKTYTMGTSGMTNSESDGTLTLSFNSSLSLGIIPRAIETIFDAIANTDPTENEMQVSISYLELYNEDLIDLLVDVGPSEARPPIIIREDKGKIIWSGIKEVRVQSPGDVSR